MAPPSSSFALDFLRRLLCAHSSTGIAQRRPRGADDGDVAAGVGGLVRWEEGVEAGKSPCIVARLMGLDAMPAAVPARDQQPLRRSRSASSAEGCPCFVDDDAPRPRVIRTASASASFREKPTYLRRENDEFLLLSFSPEDDDHDDGKTGSSLLASRSDGEGDNDDEIAGRRGRRRGDGARKQRRGRRRRPRRRYGGYEEEVATPGRSATTAECSPQNSSPVSVLEQESSSTTSSSIEEAEPCSPSSGEVQHAPREQQQQQQGSRRKLLQPESDDLADRLPVAASSTCRLSRFADRERGNRIVVNQDDGVITLPDVAAIWQPVCRLLEEDLGGGVKWEGMGNATNIAAGVESEILDQLICEATDELVQLM